MPSLERHVEAPPSAVWTVLGDLPHWADHLRTVDAIRELTATGPAVGARYEVRQPGLPRAVYEVTRWHPGTGFTWESAANGLVSTATHEVRPDGDGSVLTLSFTWTGVLAPVAALLFGRKARAFLGLEAEDVARLAEHAARPDRG